MVLPQNKNNVKLSGENPHEISIETILQQHRDSHRLLSEELEATAEPVIHPLSLLHRALKIKLPEFSF